MIRVVLFDLDDTLFAHREAVVGAIRAQTERLGYDRSAESAGALWRELEEKHYHRYLAGEIGFEDQRRARAADYAAANGIVLDDAGAASWFAGYYDHYVEGWHLHDDALPTLAHLTGRGIRVGVITNGELDAQSLKITGVGLDERFEHVIASGEVGATKPDPRIFAHACALFSVSPAETLYVGDRLATDAVGAAEAGLTGVFLDRPGAPAADRDALAAATALGVVRITSLDQLPAVVAAR